MSGLAPGPRGGGLQAALCPSARGLRGAWGCLRASCVTMPTGPSLTVAVVPSPLAGPQCPHGCQRSGDSCRAPQEWIRLLGQGRSGGKEAPGPGGWGGGVCVKGPRPGRGRGAARWATTSGVPSARSISDRVDHPCPFLRFCPRPRAGARDPSLRLVATPDTLLVLQVRTGLWLWPLIGLPCGSVEQDSFPRLCSERFPPNRQRLLPRGLGTEAPASVRRNRLSPPGPEG